MAFTFIITFFAETFSVPIDTPDTDERNDFVIRCPEGWGYRTFKGNNGLIGVFWPRGTSFNLTDTAVFVFLQDDDEPLPKIPDNINLFNEKCTKARFKFDKGSGRKSELTRSLGEKYFNGRCGRTMVILKEQVENYNIVILAASAKRYITKSQLSDIKEMAKAYRKEAEAYIKEMQDDEAAEEKAEKEEKEAKNAAKSSSSSNTNLAEEAPRRIIPLNREPQQQAVQPRPINLLGSGSSSNGSNSNPPLQQSSSSVSAVSISL